MSAPRCASRPSPRTGASCAPCSRACSPFPATAASPSSACSVSCAIIPAGWFSKPSRIPGSPTRCELAVCSAPAEGRLPPRLIRPDDVGEEVRGAGTNTRYVRNVLPASAAAERLLVVEVLTPGGHWSSYPPHKHDSDHGGETQLEETYYHRLARPGGFAFQRVYTDDRTLDETMTVEDRDVVLVPRGYHPVSAAHGFDLYYLNVIAGRVRGWRITTTPGYVILEPPPPAVIR